MQQRPAVPFNVAAGAVRQAAAGQAVLARQRGQGANSPHRLPAPAIALQAVGNFNQAGPGRSVAAGQVDNGFFRQAGNGRHALRRVIFQPLAELRPANGVPVEPGFIMQFFLNYYVGHAQRQRAVGAGQGGNVPVGPARGAGTARVNNNYLAAVALGVFKMGHKVGRGANRVVAPNNHQFAARHIAVRLAVARAQRFFHGVLGGRAANGTLQPAGPQAIPEAPAGDAHLHQPQRAAVAVGQNSLGAIPVDNFLPAFGNLANGLGPGKALPLAAAFGANAPQRVGQPVGVVDPLQVGAHFGAQPAPGDGVARVGIKIYRPAILHLGDNAAGVRAIVGAGPIDALCRHGCLL